MIELKCVRIEGGENALKSVTFEQLPSRRGLTLDGVDANGLVEGVIYTFAQKQEAPAPVAEEPATAEPDAPAETPTAAPLVKAKK